MAEVLEVADRVEVLRLGERVARPMTSVPARRVELDHDDLALAADELSPVLLAPVLERLSAHPEVLREHPLTTRRYDRRIAYQALCLA
jgi:fructoselysine-6-P-deglycase FrlB-like protein